MRESTAYRFDTSTPSAVEGDGTNPNPGSAGERPLSEELLDKNAAYWQARNYLTIGQIYLQDNPLLREPLEPSHIKRASRALGTSPALAYYVHLNRSYGSAASR